MAKFNALEYIVRRSNEHLIQRIDSRTNTRYRPVPDHLRPLEGEHPADTMARLLPDVPIPRADRHLDLWDWAATITPGEKPDPRVEIWARGGAKSTMAELIAVYCAVSMTRKFAFYLCSTQNQADLHIQSIAGLLEQIGIKRQINIYSSSVGWTAQRIQTENGWGAIAVGLNKGLRGARLGQFRPDLFIIDDVDKQDDTEAAIQKKIRIISTSVLPAGSTDSGVIFIQNLIHPRSVIARVADGSAGIMLNARVTQEPAVLGLEYEPDQSKRLPDGRIPYRVTAGVPTWPEGQSLATCEAQINEWGLRAFLSESQHEDEPDGGLWHMDRDLTPYRVAKHPELIRIVIGVDPSGGTGTETGIIAAGIDITGHAYVLSDDSTTGTSAEWSADVVTRYNLVMADCVAVEVNYGGDMAQTIIKACDRRVNVKMLRATRGKLLRAEPIHQKYQQGLVHHVGYYPELERELCQWTPSQQSPNRLDALVWCLTELLLGETEGEWAQTPAAWR